MSTEVQKMPKVENLISSIEQAKSKTEIQMFKQAQQFNSSNSSAFMPMLCYMLCF